jgi:hypothetical protein
MTMQIKSDQLIAGYSAFRVRHLLRHIRIYDAVTGFFPAEILGISETRARALSSRLEKLGFIRKVAPEKNKKLNGKRRRAYWFEATELGASLAMASGAPRITRSTANRVVDEFLSRVSQANQDSRYLYRITAVLVWGSYLSERENLGDVDFAIELTPRSTDDGWFTKMYREKISEAYAQGRRFRNLTEEYLWPRTEVWMFLRNRSRSISIHELQELVDLAHSKPMRYRILVGDALTIRRRLGPLAIEA